MVDGEHEREWGTQIAALKEIDRLLRHALERCRAMQADAERDRMAETDRITSRSPGSSQV